MRRILLLLLLLIPTLLLAQNSRYDDVAWKFTSGGTWPAAGVTVTVCTSGGSGIPCTPLATIFSDQAGSFPITGNGSSFVTDSRGNYGFFAAPGTYVVTLTGTGFQSYSKIITLYQVGNGLGNTGIANTWTALQTFTGGLTSTGPNILSGITTSTGQAQVSNVNTLNTVIYVGSGITNWTGSDIGAQINNAYQTGLPATGGTIVVLPKTGGGSYQFSTPITFNVAHKTVLLVGVGPAGTPNQSQNQGTILEYTPTSGTAILFDDLDASGSGYARAHGMRDIALWNNHTFTTGGTGSSAIGVGCGTNTQACQLAEFTGVLIGGFGTGISVTNANSWGWTVNKSSIVYNTTGIAPLGENVNLTDNVIAANGTAISGNCPELNIKGGSIDSNSVAAINYTNSAGACILHIEGTHFENLGLSGGTFGLPYITGNPNLQMFGGVMIDDQSTGNNANGYISIGTGGTIRGTQFASSGRTENSGVIQLTGSGVSRIDGEVYNQSPSTLPTVPWTFVGGSQSKFATFSVISATSSVAVIGEEHEGSLVSTGTAAGLSGTGACATRSSQAGGSWSGSVQCTGTTGASTIVVTPGITAPNGLNCFGSDRTSGVSGAQSGNNTATCTLTFASVTANDVVTFTVVGF